MVSVLLPGPGQQGKGPLTLEACCLCGQPDAPALYIPEDDESGIKEASYNRITLQLFRYPGSDGDASSERWTLYRKDLTAKEKKYKKIRSGAWEGEDLGSGEYTDTNMTVQHKYSYVARSYVIIDGVKHYSDYSETAACRAVYQKPHLTGKVVKKWNGRNGLYVIRLKNSAKSGTVKLGAKKSSRFAASDSFQKPKDSVIAACSKDGRKWKNAGKTMKLKPGEILYLRYKVSGTSLKKTFRKKAPAYLYQLVKEYEGISGYFDYGEYVGYYLKIKVKNAKTSTDGFSSEYYD